MLEVCIDFYSNPPQSCGASPAMWDHTCHPTQVSCPSH